MDSQKVDSFIMANGKFFHDYQIGAIRELLLGADDAKWPMLQALQFKDPTITLIISIIGGSLGTFLSGSAWSRAGWGGVAATGAMLALCSLVITLTAKR